MHSSLFRKAPLSVVTITISFLLFGQLQAHKSCPHHPPSETEDYQISFQKRLVRISDMKTALQFVPSVEQPCESLSASSKTSHVVRHTLTFVSAKQWNSFQKLRAFAIEFGQYMNLPSNVLTVTEDERKCSFRIFNNENDSSDAVDVDISLVGSDHFYISSQIFHGISSSSSSGADMDKFLQRVRADDLSAALLSLGSLVHQEDGFTMQHSVPIYDLEYPEFRDTVESFCDTTQFVKEILLREE